MSYHGLIDERTLRWYENAEKRYPHTSVRELIRIIATTIRREAYNLYPNDLKGVVRNLSYNEGIYYSPLECTFMANGNHRMD